MDLIGFLKRTCLATGQQEGGWLDEGAGGWAETTACTMFAQDSNSFHGKEAAAPLHRRVCTSCGDIYMHVCICMYIYMYVYVHIFAYVHIYISMHICMCMCMYVYIYLCTHYAYMYVHVYVYIYMYIYESIRIFAESMHAFTGVVEHHACAGVYVRQML